MIPVLRLGQIRAIVHRFSGQYQNQRQKDKADPVMLSKQPDPPISDHHRHGKQPQNPVIGFSLPQQIHYRLCKRQKKQNRDHQRAFYQHDANPLFLFCNQQIQKRSQKKYRIPATAAVILKNCHNLFQRNLSYRCSLQVFCKLPSFPYKTSSNAR